MTKPLYVARLSGTQAEMGAQHGRLVADDAARLFEFYRTMPERTLVGDVTGPPGVAARWLARQFAGAWQGKLAEKRPAAFAERTRAFVDAVVERHPDLRGARDTERLLATMDTMQNCVSVVARAHLGPFAKSLAARASLAAIPACSTAIAWGSATEDGELLFGRNFDFPGVGVWDAAPAFVVCDTKPLRYGFFATRGADAPVVTVVNEAGLVLAPHTRWHKDVTWRGAMIVDLVHAIAARAETLADAVKLAREMPASSSWGLAIGSARERDALVIELAGPHVEVVRPTPGSDVLICTNRYRAPAMHAGEFSSGRAWSEHPERREHRLRTLVAQRTRPLDAQTIARFLGDRGAQNKHLGSELAQATNVHCAVVKPSARRAWVGVDAAPTCEGDFAALGWTWDGPAGGWELGATATSGFTAELVPGFVAPQDAATKHVHAAARAYEASHDVPATRAALERAVVAAPTDPSLRLAAAWLAMGAGARDVAVDHVHAGLAHERDDLRRAQLLLWGARAATDKVTATRWRAELAAMSGPDVADCQAAALRRHSGKPHVNLMMMDAY